MEHPFVTPTKSPSQSHGWRLDFRHPLRLDSCGHPGLIMRRRLDTDDETEAEQLREQLARLLAEDGYWSPDQRDAAARDFDPRVVAAFFDGMATERALPISLREARLPLPGQTDNYSRVMFTGTTGAGKTTLLRHVIGSSHAGDRFPSTSTARTTTADIEIITADEPFAAVVTFMSEQEVRAHIDECLEDACLSVVQGHSRKKIADALLAHREQRFRLSYPLGGWREEQAPADDEFGFDDAPVEEIPVVEQEAVSTEETRRNQARLLAFIERIETLAQTVGKRVAADLGPLDGMINPDDRAGWLEIFADLLFEEPDFAHLALDLMDAVAERFTRIEAGSFEYSPTGWPVVWTLKEPHREPFLQQMRWFASNHYRQFGRLLTPLVNGLRVRGPLLPGHDQLQVAPRLVLIDGEGIGHSTKSASSISTRVTRRFAEVDMILLVDNAEQPMQGAPLELLRSVGSSGHADKLAIAFTHFDLVHGSNFSSFADKRDHVMQAVRDAIGTLKQSLGAPVAAMLDRQSKDQAFFLGGLDREIHGIPLGFRKQLHALLEAMQRAGEPPEPVDAEPIYSLEGLEIALRDAVEAFQNPWQARLGRRYDQEIEQEHWTRVKALSRRFANAWANEYDDLRPVADLVARLQESISQWLDRPTGWTRLPADDEERNLALAPIRKAVFTALHDLADTRLTEQHQPDWVTAFDYSGSGSSYRRAEEIEHIYQEAAPRIEAAMSEAARAFLHSLNHLVRTAVTANGGRLQDRSNSMET